MRPVAASLTLLLGGLVATAASALATTGYRSVPLTSIQTLTLYPDELTLSRRSQPIPQLTCVGQACRKYSRYVHVVQCQNVGDDGTGNVQWQCTADLPQALRLGRVEVSCEGWSRPGDKNVLQGSCGLEYSLFKDSGGIGEGHRDSGFCSSDACAGFLTTMFNVLFFAVLALIVVSFIRAFLGDRRRRPDSSLTDSPPPPYTPGPGGPPGGKSPRPTQDPAVPGWRPGFWTGLGLASVGGWLWNLTRPRATTGEYPQRQRPYQPSYGGVDDPFRRDEDDQHRWNQPGPSRHAGRSHQRDDGDSGGLGRVRQSVGFGGSSVR